MSVNQIETNLEAVTISIAYLEKLGNCNPELLEELRKERDRLLKELNIR